MKKIDVQDGFIESFSFPNLFWQKRTGEQMSQTRGETEPWVAKPESADQNKAIKPTTQPDID